MHIVLVHSEADIINRVREALLNEGYEVSVYGDPMAALDALESSEGIDLLITRVNFGEGKPHGIALARMARMKRVDIKVIFTARAEFRIQAAGLGEFIETPIDVPELLKTVRRLLFDNSN